MGPGASCPFVVPWYDAPSPPVGSGPSMAPYPCSGLTIAKNHHREESVWRNFSGVGKHRPFCWGGIGGCRCALAPAVRAAPSCVVFGFPCVANEFE